MKYYTMIPSIVAIILLSSTAAIPAFAVTNTIPVGSAPYGIAVNSQTNKVYVANYGDGTVSVIDGNTNTVTNTVHDGNGPYGIAVNSQTNKVYVTNYDENTVSVIDGSTNAVTNTIPVGISPGYIVVNSQTNKVYESDGGSNTLTEIDGSTNAVTNTIPVGSGPVGITIDEQANKVYVASNNDGAIYEVDPVTSIVSLIVEDGGTNPQAVKILSNTLYEIDTVTNSVYPIDLTTHSSGSPIPVGNLPLDIAVNPLTNTLYVANYGDGTVSVIDGNTNTVINTISVGGGPFGIAVNAANNNLYVANSADSTVTFTSIAQSQSQTPLQKTNDVITSLNGLTAKNNHNAKDLSSAINQLTKSVNTSLWASDGIHLNPKKGSQVFDYGQSAVGILMNMIKSGKESQSFNDSIQSNIDSLIDADKEISTTAISDASQISDKDAKNQVVAANKEMDKAQVDINKNKFADAIEHFEEAWNHAQNALNQKPHQDHDNHGHHNFWKEHSYLLHHHK